MRVPSRFGPTILAGISILDPKLRSVYTQLPLTFYSPAFAAPIASVYPVGAGRAAILRTIPANSRRLSSSAMSRSKLSLAGLRMAYLTPRSSSAS